MNELNWEQRLEEVYELMHEMSRQTEPQDMVNSYAARVSKMFPVDRRLSLSRRGLNYPNYRITRYTGWETEINPWTDKEKLPLLSGGILAEMIYSNRHYLIDELQVPADDPAAAYLQNQRSLMAIPMLDSGESLNMVVSTREIPAGFDRERFPDTFWLANLFGRATHNLVLKQQVRTALEEVDRELKMVSKIQQSLLPSKMPDIPGLELAAYYRTSQRAGGDYYDFFPLTDNRWGILIADVSGHGTPAAVMMAITHSIAHLYPGEAGNPAELLSFVNRRLCQNYTNQIEAFVTAFYGIYDADTRQLTYTSAGHNPPRLWKCQQKLTTSLQHESGFPLGVYAGAVYHINDTQLAPGDRLILYTDGITEAMNADGQQFGLQQLDAQLNQACLLNSPHLLEQIVNSVETFTGQAPPTDDRTLVVATVRQ